MGKGTFVFVPEQYRHHDGDREMLLLVGQVLGAYDLNTQLKELCQLREKMTAKAQELLEEDIRERRLYTALGPLMGLAVCILI